MQKKSSGERNFKFHEGQIVKWDAKIIKIGDGLGIVRGPATTTEFAVMGRMWIVQLVGEEEGYDFSCVTLPEILLSPEKTLSTGGI